MPWVLPSRALGAGAGGDNGLPVARLTPSLVAGAEKGTSARTRLPQLCRPALRNSPSVCRLRDDPFNALGLSIGKPDGHGRRHNALDVDAGAGVACPTAALERVTHAAALPHIVRGAGAAEPWERHGQSVDGRGGANNAGGALSGARLTP